MEKNHQPSHRLHLQTPRTLDTSQTPTDHPRQRYTIQKNGSRITRMAWTPRQCTSKTKIVIPYLQTLQTLHRTLHRTHFLLELDPGYF